MSGGGKRSQQLPSLSHPHVIGAAKKVVVLELDRWFLQDEKSKIFQSLTTISA